MSASTVAEHPEKTEPRRAETVAEKPRIEPSLLLMVGVLLVSLVWLIIQAAPFL